MRGVGAPRGRPGRGGGPPPGPGQGGARTERAEGASRAEPAPPAPRRPAPLPRPLARSARNAAEASRRRRRRLLLSFPPPLDVRPSVRLSVRPRSGQQHGRRQLQRPPPGAAGGVRGGDSGGERGRLVSPPPPPPGPFVPAPPPPRLCFHPAPPPCNQEGRGKSRNGAAAREGQGGAAFVRAGGGAGPGGALPGPERPQAVPVARWERWPDAGRGDAGSSCVARGRMALWEPIPRPLPSHPGPGGQVCTGRPRAPSPPSPPSSGRGPGGDEAGTEPAEPAQPVWPSPARPQHKGKLGRGRSGAGWGPGRPAHRGASRSWGVMERRSLPHSNHQATPVPLRGRGGGRDESSSPRPLRGLRGPDSRSGRCLGTELPG